MAPSCPVACSFPLPWHWLKVCPVPLQLNKPAEENEVQTLNGFCQISKLNQPTKSAASTRAAVRWGQASVGDREERNGRRRGEGNLSPVSSSIGSAVFPFKWFEPISLWGPGVTGNL